MKLGIIGMGIIGKTYFDGYKYLGWDVRGYDRHPERRNVDSVAELLDTDGLFLCLPTICREDETIDLAPYEEILPQLKDYKGAIFLRSTLMPGSTKKFSEQYGLDLYHVPEFLTEKGRVMDFFHPSRVLIGVDHLPSQEEFDTFSRFFGMFRCPILVGHTVDTELAKVASNVALATKIIYANEMDQICKVNGASWESVKRMIIDPRINTEHMKVSAEGGYSGMCLPKDTKQIIQDSISKGYTPSFFKEIDASNDRFRRKAE